MKIKWWPYACMFFGMAWHAAICFFFGRTEEGLIADIAINGIACVVAVFMTFRLKEV